MKFLAAVSAGLAFVFGACDTQAQSFADVPGIYSMIRSNVDAADGKGGTVANWDVDGWIGGDTDKLWLRSEGKLRTGNTENAEIEAYWSRNVSDFWDFQTGLREDFSPHGRSYAAIGVEGLAPYFFETSAHLFISSKGDVSARLRQSIDLPLTQRLILEPHAGLDIAADDVRDERAGAGLSDVKLGLQLRYEIVRKFAPYIDFVWEKSFAKTATFNRAAGEPVEETTLRAGIRFWF